MFDAEYLVKKTAADQDYEEVLQTLGSLLLDARMIRNSSLNSREYILKKLALERENVAGFLREYWRELNG